MLIKLVQMRKVVGLLLLSCSIAMVGCANTTKQEEGTVIGAVLGGVIAGELGDHDRSGKRDMKILVGALVGGMIGNQIGKYMDDTDRLKAGQVLETNPTGVGSTWVNPDTNYKYNVTPTNTYTSDTGPCREYTTEVIIGGKVETLYGTACRQRDGSWQAAN